MVDRKDMPKDRGELRHRTTRRSMSVDEEPQVTKIVLEYDGEGLSDVSKDRILETTLGITLLGGEAVVNKRKAAARTALRKLRVVQAMGGVGYSSAFPHTRTRTAFPSVM